MTRVPFFLTIDYWPIQRPMNQRRGLMKTIFLQWYYHSFWFCCFSSGVKSARFFCHWLLTHSKSGEENSDREINYNEIDTCSPLVSIVILEYDILLTSAHKVSQSFFTYSKALIADLVLSIFLEEIQVHQELNQTFGKICHREGINAQRSLKNVSFTLLIGIQVQADSGIQW